MKLHEHILARMNLVGRYGPEGIEVNGRSFARPLIVAPGFVLENWIVDAAALSSETLAPLWPLDPRIVLLGGRGVTAEQLKSLRRTLTVRDIALEAMDLGAACRTYNVLAQEDRAVAALLLPG